MKVMDQLHWVQKHGVFRGNKIRVAPLMKRFFRLLNTLITSSIMQKWAHCAPTTPKKIRYLSCCATLYARGHGSTAKTQFSTRCETFIQQAVLWWWCQFSRLIYPLSLLGFTHSIEISQLLWARDENGGAAYIHLTCPAKNGQNWRVNSWDSLIAIRDPITSLTLTTEHENPLKYLITSRPLSLIKWDIFYLFTNTVLQWFFQVKIRLNPIWYPLLFHGIC